jgi:carboxypeptidase C (cathepsin A)
MTLMHRRTGDAVTRSILESTAAQLTRRAFCAALACLLVAAPAVAWGQAVGAGAARVSVTEHSIDIGGTALDYEAAAGLQPIADDHGKVLANVFYVAYTKRGVADEAPRPVTFVFNGGPGAASVILHLDAVGPKRVVLTAADAPAASNSGWIDNRYTWLAFTDLVVVDAIGTGYSRAAAGVSAAQFYQPDGDALSFARFIRAYLTAHHRERSPKFLAGESYGGTRAAILARLLPRRFAISLSGVILISPVLDFATLNSEYGNPDRSTDLAFALDVPTYAATAAYYKKLRPDLDADLPRLLREVEQWSTTVYLPALVRGDQLSDAEQAQIASTLSQYTGISEAYIRAHHLRLLPRDFRRQLLEDQHLSLDVMDGRVAADPHAARGGTEAAIGPLGGIFKDYAQRELGYTTNEPYVTLSGTVGRQWDWQSDGLEGPLNVTDDLRQAMQQNPGLRVLVARGYYDLDVPYYGTEYALNQLRLEPAAAANLTRAYYDSGHMVYTSEPMLAKFTADAAALIGGSVPGHQ